MNFALLGLLWQEARSGYDLRKIFSQTPMMTFSDSPGAIYPALRRLEQRRLISGVVDAQPGRRGRRLFELTQRGRAEFRGWQAQPVSRRDVVRHPERLMLRFAFMDVSASKGVAVRFLRGLQKELAAYIPTLQEYLNAYGQHMPRSGRLALETGIQDYVARLRWSKAALKSYLRSERRQ